MPEEPIKKPPPVPVVDADTAPSSYVDWAFPYFHFPPGHKDRSDAVLSLSLGRFRTIPPPLQPGETPPPEVQVKIEFVAQMTMPTLRALRDELNRLLAPPDEAGETSDGPGPPGTNTVH